jgi:hypothetical protein
MKMLGMMPLTNRLGVLASRRRSQQKTPTPPVKCVIDIIPKILFSRKNAEAQRTQGTAKIFNAMESLFRPSSAFLRALRASAFGFHYR